MNQYQPVTGTATGAVSTNKVVRNTYTLLAATLGFSALTAGVSIAMNLPHPGLLITLVGYFGLLFLTTKTRNSGWGIVSVFALTGFMGHCWEKQPQGSWWRDGFSWRGRR